MLYKKTIIVLVILLGSLCSVSTAYCELPRLGAQVIIEPGQTDKQIDLWFKRLNESGMNVCRVRMFEEYMHGADGEWDFTLFDKAFVAADKYGIGIFATLFPSMPGNSIGGFKVPESHAHEKQIAEYVANVVTHYRSFSAFYGWVLVNEPGTGGILPETEYTVEKFNIWKNRRSKSSNDSKGYHMLKNFDKQYFLVDYNTWYLNWLADQVAKYDQEHQVHVNNHQIFENIAEYDFPSWRKFLTSLGASAHPSWHYGIVNRDEYALGMSANCGIIRSGAGELPFWVTELQGGNNTFSGATPFCPTAEEIRQWLWTSIVSGVKGVIFWSLNPRSLGEEAGEWALLDFQNNPSDRLEAAKEVSDVLKRNEKLFSNVQPINSNIYILYNRNSLWVEKEVQYGYDYRYEGRQPGGVIKSAIGYYETLSENGIVPNLSEFGEFDWTKQNYSGVSIILANVISLPSWHWDNIRDFVRNGGALFVDGITGFYDENMLSLFCTGFPLRDVFGGTLKEVKCAPGDFSMDIHGDVVAHLWKGYISNDSGSVICDEKEGITGIVNKYGEGKVVWIPSMLGMGARRSGNGTGLSRIIKQELEFAMPICLERYEKDIFMQTSKGDGAYLSLVINKSREIRTINIKSTYSSKIIYADKNAKLKSNILTINPEETVLLEWN